MKNLLLTALLLCIPILLSAQDRELGINDFDYSPASPITSDDSLTFYYDVTVGSSDCRLIYSSHWIHSDTFFVELLQESGNMFAFCDAKDTIPIGRLNPNCYTLTTYLKIRNYLGEVYDKDTMHYENFCVQKGLGTHSESLAPDIHFYPNPAVESIFIEVPTALQKSNVQIYSVLGQLKLLTEIRTNQSISIADLEKGLYFIRFDDAKIVPLILE